MIDLDGDPRLKHAVDGLRTMLDLRVRDIMDTDFETLDVDDLLATAARTMIEKKVGGLVIMDGSRVFAVLSSWDLLHKSYLESFSDKMDYLRTPLRDIIDRPHYEELAPTATLATALSIMARTNTRTIPIVEDDELVGAVTMMDLMKAYDRLILNER